LNSLKKETASQAPSGDALRYAKRLRTSLSGRFFPIKNRGSLLRADKGSPVCDWKEAPGH
jgi:hypothetical protein